MKITDIEIEKLMKAATDKKMILECIRIQNENIVSKIDFYLNNEKIDYQDLVKILKNLLNIYRATFKSGSIKYLYLNKNME